MVLSTTTTLTSTSFIRFQALVRMSLTSQQEKFLDDKILPTNVNLELFEEHEAHIDSDSNLISIWSLLEVQNNDGYTSLSLYIYI